MPRATRKMEITYPVAMTRQITLFHHLTQVHYQRFFQQASARMASIQGLRINGDADDEINRLEEAFTEALDKAANEIQVSAKQWRSRLEAAGVDPELNAIQGGKSFDAPITTPWSNKLLKLYTECDRALMLVEMAWIVEEITSVIEKRKASTEVRAPLVESARQVQRAVTQAFQEARRRDERVVVPPAFGESGTYLFSHAPEALEKLKEADATDTEAFSSLIDTLKSQHESDKTAVEAIKEIGVIKLALAESNKDKADKSKPAREPADSDDESESEDEQATEESEAEEPATDEQQSGG